MQTVDTDVRGVCLSVCHTARAVRAGSSDAAFVKLLWHLVVLISDN